MLPSAKKDVQYTFLVCLDLLQTGWKPTYSTAYFFFMKISLCMKCLANNAQCYYRVSWVWIVQEDSSDLFQMPEWHHDLTSLWGDEVSQTLCVLLLWPCPMFLVYLLQVISCCFGTWGCFMVRTWPGRFHSISNVVQPSAHIHHPPLTMSLNAMFSFLKTPRDGFCLISVSRCFVQPGLEEGVPTYSREVGTR